MKKVTIEIDERYGTILSVTAVGQTPYEVCVSTGVVSLRETDKIKFDENGKVQTSKEEA